MPINSLFVQEIRTDFNNALHYDKETKTFSGEMSSLDACFSMKIKLINPKTGNSRIFTYYKKDTDGEDVYGYWYKSDDGLQLLLIND